MGGIIERKLMQQRISTDKEYAASFEKMQVSAAVSPDPAGAGGVERACCRSGVAEQRARFVEAPRGRLA